MKSNRPRVSIGLPVYNGQNYLAAALDSLLGQTYSDFELIISDNASTDATEEISRDYAARDPRVRYERLDHNRGANWNFNHSFQLSTGEYFKWAAHDDVCAPTFLERCVGLLDRDPTTVLAHPRSTIIGPDGRLLMEDQAFSSPSGVERCHAEEYEADLASRRFRAVLLYAVWGHEIFGVARAAALRRTRLFRPYAGAEKVLLAELSLLGRWREAPEILFYARRHAEQFTMIPSAREQEAWVDPTLVGHLHMPRLLRCTRGYCGLVMRARLGLAERARCLSALGQYVFQVRKWRQAVAHMFTGASMADRNLRAARSGLSASRGVTASHG